MPWYFFHPSVRFVTSPAFSIGGKFLLLSQKPGRLFVTNKQNSCFWMMLYDCRLVLTVREPTAWYRSVATTLLPLVGQIDRLDFGVLGEVLVTNCCLFFCTIFLVINYCRHPIVALPHLPSPLSPSSSTGGAFYWGSCAGFSTRAPSRSNSLASSSGGTPPYSSSILGGDSPGRFQYSWFFTILNLFSSGSQLRSKELQEETSAVRLFDF